MLEASDATDHHDAIVVQLRTALTTLYGDRLEKIVLFGSRSRGDHRADSDYDVAVFLRDMNDRWAEFDRLAPVVDDILVQSGMFVHMLPYRAASINDRTPIMHEIRKDGRTL